MKRHKILTSKLHFFIISRKEKSTEKQSTISTNWDKNIIRSNNFYRNKSNLSFKNYCKYVYFKVLLIQKVKKFKKICFF